MAKNSFAIQVTLEQVMRSLDPTLRHQLEVAEREKIDYRDPADRRKAEAFTNRIRVKR